MPTASLTPLEIEAKFSFRKVDAFTAWLEKTRLGPFMLTDARSVATHDTYLDSIGRDCLVGGYACRVRRRGDRATATLKSLANAAVGDDAGVRRRVELDVDLPVTPAAEDCRRGELAPAWQQPAAWPESAARILALRLLDGRPLQYLATIQQERHERDLRDGERVAALLSLDRVSFDDGAPLMYELEVELTSAGTEADLSTVVALLRGDPTFEPAARSKLQRALESAAAQSDRLLADQPIAMAGRVVMGRQFTKLAHQLDRAVGPDDPDAVDIIHDARVAARRLRAAVLLFRRAYPRSELRPLDRGLARLGATLGTVRDLDVLIEASPHPQPLAHRNGREGLQEEAGSDSVGEFIALVGVWQQERMRAWGELQTLLGSRRHRLWLRRWSDFLEGHSHESRGEERLCDVVPALVWRWFGAVRRRGLTIESLSLPDLHDLRKGLRRLRYALEFLCELLGEEGPGLIKRAVAMQDALGSLNDTHLLAGLLKQRLLAAEDGAGAPLATHLAETLTTLAERRQAAEALWPTIEARRFRRDLGKALAEL